MVRDRAVHLVEAGEFGGAVFVQVEAGIDGGAQQVVPGVEAVTQHEVGVWGEDGREVGSLAKRSVAALQGCVALFLEVPEGSGAVRCAKGEGHTRNMALVPVTAVGEGRERSGKGPRVSSTGGP